MGKEKDLRNDRDVDVRQDQTDDQQRSSPQTQATADQQSNAWLTADKTADRQPDETGSDAMTMLRQFAGLRRMGKATPSNSITLIKPIAIGRNLHDLATQIAQIEAFVNNGTLGAKFRVDQALPALQALDATAAAIYSALLQERLGSNLSSAIKELQKTATKETKHDALAAIARSYRAAGTANAKPAVDALVELRKAGLDVLEIEQLVRGTDEWIPLTEAELMASLTGDQQEAYTLSASALKRTTSGATTTDKRNQTSTSTSTTTTTTQTNVPAATNSATATSKDGKTVAGPSYGPFQFTQAQLAGVTPETAKVAIGASLINGAAEQYNKEHPDAPVQMSATVASFFASTNLVLSIGERELTSVEVFDAVNAEGGWSCTLARDYFDKVILPSAKDPRAFDVAMLDHQISELDGQIEMASLEPCTVDNTTTSVPGLLDKTNDTKLFDLRRLRVLAMQARRTEYQTLRTRVSSGETTLAAERDRLRQLAQQAREEAAKIDEESRKTRARYEDWKGQSRQAITPGDRQGLAAGYGDSAATLDDLGRKSTEMKTFADGKAKFADEIDALAGNPFAIVTPKVISDVERANNKKFEFVGTDEAIMSAVGAGAEDTGAFFLRVAAGAVQLNGYTPTGLVTSMPLPGLGQSLGGLIQTNLRDAATALETDSAKNHQIAASVLGEFGASLIQIGTGALIQTALTAGAGGLIGLLGRGATAATTTTSTTMRVAQTAGLGGGLNVLANADKDGATIAKSAITGALPGGAAGFKTLLPKLVYTFFAAGMTDVVQSSNFTAGYKVLTEGGDARTAADLTFKDVNMSRVAANSLVSVAGELAQYRQQPTQANETTAAPRHFVTEVDGVQSYYRALPDGSLESLGSTKAPNAVRLTRDEFTATQAEPAQRDAALFTAENRALQKDTEAVPLQASQREARARVMMAIEAQEPIAAKDLAASKVAMPAGYRKNEVGDTFTYDNAKAVTDRVQQQQQAMQVADALQQHVAALREINTETAQLQAAIKKPGTPKAELERMTARLDELATRSATSKQNLVDAQQTPGETTTVKQIEDAPTAVIDEGEVMTIETEVIGSVSGLTKEQFGNDLRRMFPKLASDDVKGAQYIDAQWKNRISKSGGNTTETPVTKSVVPADKPMTANEILEANQTNEAKFSDGDRDALITNASQNKKPAQSLPEVSYTTVDSSVLQQIMDKGLLAGKALGRQGANADAIWFKQGAPFYGDGITLAIPTKRLLELGGQQDFGLAGQADIIKVSYDKLPAGIPFNEFAVVSSVGQNFIEPIYTPKNWKGPLGVGFDETTKSGAVLGTKSGENPMTLENPTTKSSQEPSTRIDEPTSVTKPTTETSPTNVAKTPTTEVATPTSTTTKTESSIPKPTTPLTEKATLAPVQELDQIADRSEKASHNEGAGSIGSCTWAAIQNAIAAEKRGWSAEIVIIDGEATSASTDASLGTSGAGTTTQRFGHAVTAVTLPDGTVRYLSWGKTFASLQEAIASNPAIIAPSVTVRGRYTAFEETMRLLNENGYVRPVVSKDVARTYAMQNQSLDPNPSFTKATHPWNYSNLEIEDATVLMQDATSNGHTNPTQLEIEAYSPAGEGFSKFFEKMRVNGVEQSLQNRNITTRFSTTILAVTNSSGAKVYGVRTPVGEVRYAVTLEDAIKLSRIGERTWWRADQVSQGTITDGTIEAYKDYQKSTNTPSTQKQQE